MGVEKILAAIIQIGIGARNLGNVHCTIFIHVQHFIALFLFLNKADLVNS